MRLIDHTRHSGVASVRVRRMLLSGAIALTVLLVASPVPATGAPAARAATGGAAEIEARLSATEASAASASTRALAAAATAEQARVEAEAAAAHAAAMSASSAAADEAADARTAAAGAALYGRYRAENDGPLLARLLVSAEPATLLARLAVLDRAGSAAMRAAVAAREAAEVAAGLNEQAAVAETERERIAVAAEEAAAAARAEADAEEAAVALARRELDALYAQLATAGRTTVSSAKASRLAQQTAAQIAGGPGGAQSAPPAGSTPGGSATAPAPGPVMTPAQAQAHARGAIGGYGWGDDQHACLVSLWNRESGWRVEALNRSSGAYGIPQAYPAEKMASAGPDWRTNGATQISWGLSYIKSRYGSPCGAWDHSERVGWY